MGLLFLFPNFLFYSCCPFSDTPKAKNSDKSFSKSWSTSEPPGAGSEKTSSGLGGFERGKYKSDGKYTLLERNYVDPLKYKVDILDNVTVIRLMEE